MIKSFRAAPILTMLLLIGMALVSKAFGSNGNLPGSPSPAARDQGFVQASGRQLLQNGNPITLRSVSFSNFYKFKIGEDGFDLNSSNHHGEVDFQRVREMGFNSIRFAFNGNWHQTDPEAFWQWLDRNVGWAEKHNILLVLDLHVPIGGFWLAPNSPDVDFSLWTDAEIRKRNVELWRSIADRYKGRTAIAAYEILNEAVTEDTSGDQWKLLADDLVKAIREVDKNHLLIVGTLYGTNRRYTAKKDSFQFLVNDDNVMYDFHFYQPIEYTHQYASWVDRPLGDGGKYPDYSTPIPTGQQALLSTSRISGAKIEPGDTDWKEYSSEWVELKGTDAVAGLPIMTFRGEAGGAVFFDDVKVFEFDVHERKIRQVVNDPLDQDGVWQWWKWEAAEYEDITTDFQRVETSGSNDQYSLVIDRTSPSKKYWGWSSDRNWFKAKPGNLYKIVGNMRGTGVEFAATDPSAFIGFELDFYSNPTESGEKGFVFKDKEYLEFEFLKMFNFGIENDVPMSVMEFGTIYHTFSTSEKGGEKWVEDILDIFKRYDTSFSLWNYHGAAMGIYLSDYGSFPLNPNRKLIESLESKLSGWGESARQ